MSGADAACAAAAAAAGQMHSSAGAVGAMSAQVRGMGSFITPLVCPVAPLRTFCLQENTAIFLKFLLWWATPKFHPSCVASPLTAHDGTNTYIKAAKLCFVLREPVTRAA